MTYVTRNMLGWKDVIDSFYVFVRRYAVHFDHLVTNPALLYFLITYLGMPTGWHALIASFSFVQLTRTVYHEIQKWVNN